MNISKIIIPAAGIGSRFLPITKSIPKEMLPLSNKPAIEYIVQEAFDAQIKDNLIILSPEKKVIIDYFSQNSHLEGILQEQNRLHYLNDINNLISNARFQYFIQNKPAGLANALLHAQPAIDSDEFFAVSLPDDIIFGQNPEISNLMQVAQDKKAMVIAVQEVPRESINSYGIMAPKKQLSDRCFQIDHLIEKPPVDQAPSNLAIVGRYIFHQSLFSYIPQTKPKNGEILLPDTINFMISKGIDVYAYKIQGTRFDIGTPQGWLNFIAQNTAL